MNREINHLCTGFEMLENKHRLHKDNWRKAFIAIIITNTVNVNPAGAYL